MRKILLMISLAALAFCSSDKTVWEATAEKVPAIDYTDLDTTVAPGEDLNLYVNGGWKQKNPLRPESERVIIW